MRWKVIISPLWQRNFENTPRRGGIFINFLVENSFLWTGSDSCQHCNANAWSNIDFPLFTKNRRFSSVNTFVFVISSYFNKHIQPAVDSGSLEVITQGLMFLYHSRTTLPAFRHTTRRHCTVTTQTTIDLLFSKLHFLLQLFHAVPFWESLRFWDWAREVVVHQLADQCDTCMIKSRRWRHTLMVKRASDFSRLFLQNNLLHEAKRVHFLKLTLCK